MSLTDKDRAILLQEIEQIKKTLELTSGDVFDGDDASEASSTDNDDEEEPLKISDAWSAAPSPSKDLSSSLFNIQNDDSAQGPSNIKPSIENTSKQDVIEQVKDLLLPASHKGGLLNALGQSRTSSHADGLLSGNASGKSSRASTPAPVSSLSKHLKSRLEHESKTDGVSPCSSVWDTNSGVYSKTTTPPQSIQLSSHLSVQQKKMKKIEKVTMTNLYVERIFKSYRPNTMQPTTLTKTNKVHSKALKSSASLSTMENLLQVNKLYQEKLMTQLKQVEISLERNRRIQEELDNKEELVAGKGLNKACIGRFSNPYFKENNLIQSNTLPDNKDTIEKRAFKESNALKETYSRTWKKLDNRLLEDGVYNNNLERKISPFMHNLRSIENENRERVKRGEKRMDKKFREQVLDEISTIRALPRSQIIADSNDIDFFKISKNYLPDRSEFACRNHWCNVLHPKINQSKFSKHEDEQIVRLGHKYQNHHWELIAAEIGTNRTPVQCLQRFQRSLNGNIIKKKWTDEEDKRLREAVRIFGNYWVAVATHVGDRTPNQVMFRWEKSLNPNIKRGKWTEDEDKLLHEAVAKFGKSRWRLVQSLVPGRTDAQCRDRYMSYIDPDLSYEPFTDEENNLLVKLADKYGIGNWATIAKCMPGRNSLQLLDQYRCVEPDKYFEYRKRVHWKQPTNILTNFMHRPHEKPDYPLHELNLDDKPAFSLRELTRMENTRKKLLAEGGLSPEAIEAHVNNMLYSGEFTKRTRKDKFLRRNKRHLLMQKKKSAKQSLDEVEEIIARCEDPNDTEMALPQEILPLQNTQKISLDDSELKPLEILKRNNSNNATLLKCEGLLARFERDVLTYEDTFAALSYYLSQLRKINGKIAKKPIRNLKIKLKKLKNKKTFQMVFPNNNAAFKLGVKRPRSNAKKGEGPPRKKVRPSLKNLLTTRGSKKRKVSRPVKGLQMIRRPEFLSSHVVNLTRCTPKDYFQNQSSNPNESMDIVHEEEENSNEIDLAIKKSIKEEIFPSSVSGGEETKKDSPHKKLNISPVKESLEMIPLKEDTAITKEDVPAEKPLNSTQIRQILDSTPVRKFRSSPLVMSPKPVDNRSEELLKEVEILSPKPVVETSKEFPKGVENADQQENIEVENMELEQHDVSFNLSPVSQPANEKNTKTTDRDDNMKQSSESLSAKLIANATKSAEEINELNSVIAEGKIPMIWQTKDAQVDPVESDDSLGDFNGDDENDKDYDPDVDKAAQKEELTALQSILQMKSFKVSKQTSEKLKSAQKEAQKAHKKKSTSPRIRATKEADTVLKKKIPTHKYVSKKVDKPCVEVISKGRRRSLLPKKDLRKLHAVLKRRELMKRGQHSISVVVNKNLSEEEERIKQAKELRGEKRKLRQAAVEGKEHHINVIVPSAVNGDACSAESSTVAETNSTETNPSKEANVVVRIAETPAPKEVPGGLQNDISEEDEASKSNDVVETSNMKKHNIKIASFTQAPKELTSVTVVNKKTPESSSSKNTRSKNKSPEGAQNQGIPAPSKEADNQSDPTETIVNVKCTLPKTPKNYTNLQVKTKKKEKAKEKAAKEKAVKEKAVAMEPPAQLGVSEQLKTFTLLLAALHIDTGGIMKKLPNHSVKTTPRPQGPIPHCFPFSPNEPTILGTRTLLLNRRNLRTTAETYTGDTSYRDNHQYDALKKRFKSMFLWPTFLATFTPKYNATTLQPDLSRSIFIPQPPPPPPIPPLAASSPALLPVDHAYLRSPRKTRLNQRLTPQRLCGTYTIVPDAQRRLKRKLVPLEKIKVEEIDDVELKSEVIVSKHIAATRVRNLKF